MKTLIIVLIVSAIVLLLAGDVLEIQRKYQFNFQWVQDVNLNKILIVWYNKYDEDGNVTREHKIIYDTGRD